MTRRKETWSSRELKVLLWLTLLGLSYAREFIDGDAYVIEGKCRKQNTGPIFGGWIGKQLGKQPKGRSLS